MENTPAFHPLDYVSVLRRRMWWLVVPIVLAALVSAALALWLPRQYKATATLGVSLPGVSGQILSDAQRVTPEERIRSINQVLTSDAVISRVVREEHLDAQAPVAEMVQRVRARVKSSLPPPDPNMPYGPIEQFFVTYTDSNPELTQRVTNRLAEVFVEESSRRRGVRAEETSAFISRQLRESQGRLDQLESQLRRSKESFMGALPEQTQSNVALVTGLQQQLATTTNAMRGEQDRLSIIERQMESMRAGAAAAEIPVPGVPATASPAAVRVVQIERALAVARGNYTDKHPEMIRLRDELAAAKAAATEEANRPESERVATLRVDPTYAALVRDRDQARLRIRELQRSEEQTRAQIGVYRVRVDSAPRVEQQLATVQREYDLEKHQYSELSAKLRSAEMAESLERNRGGEGFTVLAHATFPGEPSWPNVQRLLMMTMLFGICLGGALALGREYLDRSIHDARSLNDIDVPVLGEIPHIANV